MGASACARLAATAVVRSVDPDADAGRLAGPAPDVPEPVVLALLWKLLAVQDAVELCRPDAVQFAARSFADAALVAGAELLVLPPWEPAFAAAQVRMVAASLPVRAVYSRAWSPEVSQV